MRKLLSALLAAGAVIAVSGSAAVASTAQGEASVTVSSLSDSGPGSLRGAVTAANRRSDTTTIDFSVNGTIRLKKGLPAISERTIVDGTSAPTYVAGGAPVVALNNNGNGG